MHARSWLLASAASLLVVLARSRPPHLPSPQAALTGVVSSTEEAAMEGVLVTVKQAGSKRATTVVTGSDGRYQFPRARLEPGSYARGHPRRRLRPGQRAHGVGGGVGTTTANLTLRKAHNLARAAHQLGVAGQLSGHRPAAGVGARLRALPHAGAGDALQAQRRVVHEGRGADGRLPAAGLSADAAADAGSADRRRRGVPRAAAADLAHAGRVSRAR